MTPPPAANAVAVDLPAFSGPLDLLLHLIERQELDITAISLTAVAEQYLAQMATFQDQKIEHLIDFLVIGARLVLIKSRALLPQNPVTIAGEEEEEDPAAALIRQLRRYKRFKEAAAWFQARETAGLRTYLRVAPPPRLEGKLDLSGVTAETLLAAVRNALSRAAEREESVIIVRPRRITIEGQMSRLRRQVSRRTTIGFAELLSNQATRVEVAVTLLAVLELMKRREIRAEQPEPFGPIAIAATADQAIPSANGEFDQKTDAQA